MSATDLMDKLHALGASLTLEGDRLKLRAAKGSLPASLLEAVKAGKSELTEFLQLQQGEEFPLSFGQQQLWFLDQLTPGNPMYNNPLALNITGPLDSAALAQAFDLVLHRHSVLRTIFPFQGAEPRQRVLLKAPGGLEFIDLEDLDAAAQSNAVTEHAATEARRGFDLSCELPIRARLLCCSPERHVLLITVHHICADGWSIGILMEDLFQAYAALSKGQAPSLAPLPWQYSDYAAFQRRNLSPQDLAKQLSYWTQELRDAPTNLSLPTDFPRPAEQSFAGAHLRHPLSGPAARAADALAQRLGVSVFGVFLTAHALVMSRFAGQSDICTGTPLAGRARQELEPMIGHFINTVVLRSRLQPDESFAQLARHTHDQVLQAMENQDIAFEKVVEAVNPPRSAAHSPLFQTMLIFQNTPQGETGIEGLEVTPLETDSATAKYEITLEVFQTPAGYDFGFEYNSDLFLPSTISSMARCYEQILQQAKEQPDQAQQGFCLQDAHSLIRAETSPPCPDKARKMHQCFADAAARTPDAIAVEAEEGCLTFAELDRLSDRAAVQLQALGAGPDQPVALSAIPDLGYVATLLGALKCGASVVPTGLDQPLKRLLEILETSGAGTILCSSQIAAALQQAGFAGHCLVPAVWRARLQEAPTPVPPGPYPENETAALMFTSGSSGQPKGVPVPHQGLVNLTLWTQDQFALSPNAGFVQKSSPGFDASLWEFLVPLASGRRLILANEEERQDPGKLPALVQKHQAEVLQFVPATLQLFLDGLGAAPLPSLRYIFCGGGMLTPDLAQLTAKKLPEVQLINVYGVTEACVDSCFHVYGPKDDHRASVPIGQPIANTQILLVDAEDRPVPQGAIGEICICGPAVSAAYLKDPARTAGRFSPHDLLPGQRLFRSGDLARVNGRGQLEFLGRLDFQIKHNGFRIEPGEIETALQSAGAVLAVAAQREGKLVAYVSGAENPAELRPALKEKLPAYMMPEQIILLEEMPLNASGKPDRSALPDPSALISANAVNQASPRDATELSLYNIWKSILLHPAIGIRDDFFELGGSSIAAIKLIHKIRQELGLELPLRAVFANPTIEDLAGLIRSGSHSSPGEDSLITFRRGQGGANVICIHPAGGTAFCYLSLAKILDESLGVYGLQSPGLNPGEALAPTVEDMAMLYLKQIAHLTDAPLVLTGLSYGGLVAHEMGRRLSQQGHRQVSVVLLDTQGTDDVEERRRINTVEMEEFRDKLVRFNGTYPGIEDAQIERYFNVYNHNRLTVRDYEVPVSGARLAYVQALSDLPRSYLHQSRRYWNSRTRGPFSACLVRGDHWEMLETEELKTVQRVVLSEFAAMGVSTQTEERS